MEDLAQIESSLKPQTEVPPVDAGMPPQQADHFAAMDEEAVDDVLGAVEENLNALNEQQKAFVLEHLTDENAAVIALVGGDKRIYDALKPYVKQDVMLMPMPRAQAEQMLGMGGQSPQPNTPTSGATPAAAPAQPQTQPPQPQRPPLAI